MPEFAKITPVTPPTVNRKINPIAKSIGVFNEIEPPHIVAIQLNWVKLSERFRAKWDRRNLLLLECPPNRAR